VATDESAEMADVVHPVAAIGAPRRHWRPSPPLAGDDRVLYAVGVAYHVAATEESERFLQSATFASRMDRTAQREQVPEGTCHAVPEGSAETVCGLDVDTLYEFLDVPFPNTTGTRCLICRHWIKMGVADE
jgi:hypothetical protein